MDKQTSEGAVPDLDQGNGDYYHSEQHLGKAVKARPAPPPRYEHNFKPLEVPATVRCLCGYRSAANQTNCYRCQRPLEVGKHERPMSKHSSLTTVRMTDYRYRDR